MTLAQRDERTVAVGQDYKPDLQRRTLLTGIAAAYLSSFVPPAIAQPVSHTGPAIFLNISTFLTGRSSLDVEQSARLYEALAADISEFEAGVRSLLALVADRQIDAAHLQQILDTENSPLASLPRKIVTAWYMGVVGEGGATRCVTFETSLMYQVVADRLKPPSYCHGAYSSWMEAPV
jgi:Membrane bound FAD containing D-sorbitol dehydrogenase